MKKLLSFVTHTIIGAVWFLIPIVVLGMSLAKAHQFTSKIISPLANLFPANSFFGEATARILAVLLLILICFLLAFVSRTKAAHDFIEWLESKWLANIPGYDFMKNIFVSFFANEAEDSRQVVLARIEDSWQIGFITETLDNGLYAVFVPGAPVPWSGSVYFMTENRFKRLAISYRAATKCMRRLGHGSNEFLGTLKDSDLIFFDK